MTPTTDQRVAEGVGRLAVARGPVLEGGGRDVLAQHLVDGLLVLPLQGVGQGGNPGQGAGLKATFRLQLMCLKEQSQEILSSAFPGPIRDTLERF